MVPAWGMHGSRVDFAPGRGHVGTGALKVQRTVERDAGECRGGDDTGGRGD